MSDIIYNGMKRDLVIAYRVYPGLSKLPAFFKDKKDLVQVALRTLRDALEDVDFVMYVILDGCDEVYQAFFLDTFPSDRLIFENYISGIGNSKTYLRQLEILCEQKESDLVLFAEDDYIWQPGAIRAHVNLHRDCSFVDFSSPYDHPGWYYGAKKYPPDHHAILFHGGRHWRTAACTTLTFMARRDVLLCARNVLESFSRGCLDMSLWIALTKHFVFSPNFVLRGFKDKLMWEVFRQTWKMHYFQIIMGRRFSLWAPIPSLATHLESSCLALGVDWEKLILIHSADMKNNYLDTSEQRAISE